VRGTRRTDEFNIHNLKTGQALIGDSRRCGLTRRQYRTAQKHLALWGLAAFKPTSRGTVNSPGPQDLRHQRHPCPTNKQQTDNKRPTNR